MKTQTFDVLQRVTSILHQNRPVYLITVLETWGASPRPAGSLLCFDPVRNKVSGSVSGGCIELELLEQLHAAHESGRFPTVQSYGAESGRANLPCGATLSLLVEYLHPDEKVNVYGREASITEQFQQLLTQLNEGHACQRKIYLDRQPSELRNLEVQVSKQSTVNISPVIVDNDAIKQQFNPPDRMLIIGAGDVADALIPLAQQIGYHVTLCEPRQDVFERYTGTEADALITARLPDDVVEQHFSGTEAAVVAVSHDPRVDDLALMAALCGDAHFVGALGSERTTVARKARLAELGLSQRQISRLNAPVGLDIGSRTPIEIAISIVAQLVQIKNYQPTKQLASGIFETGQFID